MKKYICCLKGESSSQAEEVQQREAQDPSGSINSADDDIDDAHLFGAHESLNNAWRSYRRFTDDQDAQDSSPDPYPGFTFRYREIVHGTLNFRQKNFLGRGNFGEVYRCHFPGIDMMGAAKTQSSNNAEVHDEFVAEITTLHAANHPNVINLLGQCSDPHHRVIVYEFMPKGSLDHHLFPTRRDRTKPGPSVQSEYAVLNWETRMKIAVGVAKALIYLHEELKTIHRDVKVSNILLDENFVPKLTDFGLATKMVEDEDGFEHQSEINPIKGTPGCIAAETEESGLVSSKSDVYSYGVFLLTLFTGRKAFDREKPPGTEKLTHMLRHLLNTENIKNEENTENKKKTEECYPLVIDVALGNRFPVEGVIIIFRAVQRCLKSQARARPHMRLVESMVSKAAAFEVPECPPVTSRRSLYEVLPADFK